MPKKSTKPTAKLSAADREELRSAIEATEQIAILIDTGNIAQAKEEYKSEDVGPRVPLLHIFNRLDDAPRRKLLRGLFGVMRPLGSIYLEDRPIPQHAGLIRSYCRELRKSFNLVGDKAEPGVTTGPELRNIDVNILQLLAKRPAVALTLYDLRKAGDRKTVGQRLRYLRSVDYAKFPEGRRRTNMITAAGRRRVTTPHVNGGAFLLTGLLKCGRCESAMSGTADPRCKEVYYKCGAHQNKGICERNSVRQSEILEAIVTVISGWFHDPGVVDTLREELRQLVREDIVVSDPGKVRAQLAGVDAKLVKAKRRMMEVDTDMLPVAQETIRELRAEHERLTAALEASQTPPDRILDEHDAEFDRSLGMLLRLQDVVAKGDPQTVRAGLQANVASVKVWSTKTVREGRRSLYHVDRGEVALKVDNLSALPRRCGDRSSGP